MSQISYNTRLVFATEADKQSIFTMLEAQRLAWNECSKAQFTLPRRSLVDLHASFYRVFRDSQPQIPSQVVISAERSVLSAYTSIKSSKHKIKSYCIKKKLSIQLDARSYSHKSGIFSIISLGPRVKCSLSLYPKLQELLNKYKFGDPLIFIRNGEVWISLSFKIPEIVATENLSLGIDLGIVNAAATSEGKLFKDKKFNGRKRKLRYIKRSLQSKGTRSARRRLNKLRHKEHNINQNFSQNLALKIIRSTEADVLVMENLKSIKVKKYKYQNKNKISQVPLYELRRILTYKALLHQKQVITVCPSYTSQIDHRTGKRDGQRIGGRYIGKDGQVLHADVNAACNIAIRSKLPCSIGNYYAWQAVAVQPIVS